MRHRRLQLVAIAGCAALIVAGAAQGAAAGPQAGPGAKPAIVGGGPADFANWEFTIALFGDQRGRPRFRCGGTVIAPTRVLTAAHCVYGVDADKLTVVAGRPKLTDTSVGERLEAASYAIHPGFDPRRTVHDFAVIRLATATSQPAITLPATDEAAAATTAGSRLRVAGWGAPDPYGFERPKGLMLKKTAQRVLRAGACLRGYTRHIFDPQLTICARGKRAPRWSRITRRIRFLIGGPIHNSPCRGDSGGPLVADTPGGPRQVGVVSYGGGICGARRFPAAYARVGTDLTFIQGV